MKDLRPYVLLFLFLTFFANLQAQKGYKNEYKTQDGVTVLYKLSHEKFFDKSSPLHLRLKIINNNDYPVEVSFSVFMEIGITDIKKSELVVICLAPGKSAMGKLHGLHFDTEVNDIKLFENNEIEWYIEPLTITKTELCVKKKKANK